MKVAVIGAGGIGSLFGGRLAVAGHEVWLVHRRPAYVEALRREGLVLDGPRGEERIPISATLDTREVGAVDVVLVLTKSMDTPAAARAALPIVADATVVLSLQNGLGNLETLADVLGAERVLLGVTYVGATLDSPGHARHTAVGKTFIGDQTARGAELARVLSEADLPTETTDQLWSMVWAKLVINAALNASAALLGASGADILRSEAATEWTGLVARETAAVAHAAGIELPYADPAARVWQHCKDVGSARPSMLQDVERQRPTEVEAINGAIVREGARLGVPTPYNQALLQLIRAREQLYPPPSRT